MDVYEKLEELQEKALHDETMKQALLATRTEKEQCEEVRMVAERILQN